MAAEPDPVPIFSDHFRAGGRIHYSPAEEAVASEAARPRKDIEDVCQFRVPERQAVSGPELSGSTAPSCEDDKRIR